MTYNPMTSALLGVAVGDALGVPFEFKSRDAMQQKPANEMVGFDTHNQPRGKWSDDMSLTLCMAESLLTGYDLKNMAELFIRWKCDAYWTAHDEVFDIGMTTLRAIHQHFQRLAEILAGQLLFLRNTINVQSHQHYAD